VTIVLSKIAEIWPGKISSQELKKKIDRGDHFILVDARDTNSYESEHMMGAISLPLSEVDEKADQLLDRSVDVIVYCNSLACLTSANEVKKLKQMGFRNVQHYAGGIQDWKKAGYPTESSSKQEAT
jgi:rhodanese-related sulfurtransferase